MNAKTERPKPALIDWKAQGVAILLFFAVAIVAHTIEALTGIDALWTYGIGALMLVTADVTRRAKGRA